MKNKADENLRSTQHLKRMKLEMEGIAECESVPVSGYDASCDSEESSEAVGTSNLMDIVPNLEMEGTTECESVPISGYDASCDSEESSEAVGTSNLMDIVSYQDFQLYLESLSPVKSQDLQITNAERMNSIDNKDLSLEYNGTASGSDLKQTPWNNTKQNTFTSNRLENLLKPNQNLEKTPIVIIGGGAGGIGAAMELANAGYQVHLYEKNKIGSGSSGSTPGRMGLGFHYTNEKTAIAYLEATIAVRQKYGAKYIIGGDDEKQKHFRQGHYYLMNEPLKEHNKITKTYEALKAHYTKLCEEDSANKIFGNPEEFIKILNISEFDCIAKDRTINAVNTPNFGVQTQECLFNWDEFVKDIRVKMQNHPNIDLHEDTVVTNIEPNSTNINEPRFTIMTNDLTGFVSSFKTNYIVNSTWYEAHKLNGDLGLQPSSPRTMRVKALLKVNLPEELRNCHSMFFCMGPHCMISNMGDGTAYATYALETNFDSSTNGIFKPKAQRFLDGKATPQEIKELQQKMIDGITEYIPDFKTATAIELKFGVVMTKGKGTIEDLNKIDNPFNERDDHCVTEEQIGVITNPCMKLFYFIDNGRLVLKLIKEQIIVTEYINKIIKSIRDDAVNNPNLLDEDEKTIWPDLLKLKNHLDKNYTKERVDMNPQEFIQTQSRLLRAQLEKSNKCGTFNFSYENVKEGITIFSKPTTINLTQTSKSTILSSTMTGTNRF